MGDISRRKALKLLTAASLSHSTNSSMADADELLAELMRDYAITFGSPSGQRVLKDLELFGHVGDPLIDDTVKDKSDRRMFMNEGRREVLLRIMKFGNFTLKDIYDLRKGQMSLRTNQGERLYG